MIEYILLAVAGAVFLLVLLAVALVVLVRFLRSPSSLVIPQTEGQVFVNAVNSLQKAAAAKKVEQIFADHVSNPHLASFQTMIAENRQAQAAVAPAPQAPPVPKP